MEPGIVVSDHKQINLPVVTMVVMLVSILSIQQNTFAAVIHVPADYLTIQQAINAAANSGDEIIVAPGTYPEAINFNGKAIYLHSSEGRDVTTIDATGLDTSVVTCVSGETANTVIDGFTITGGGALEIFGGGMVCKNSSSPTVNNCEFNNNLASYGGGMYNGGSSHPAITNCIFNGNNASYGAGMHNYNNSNPTITECTFVSNIASSGGGLENYIKCNPVITNCSFSDNHASLFGGGLYNNNNCNPTITQCSFTGNYAGVKGGGVYNLDCLNPSITYCTFTNNYGGWEGGGGMCNDHRSNPLVANCAFTGNTTDGQGGAMDNISSSPTVINCIFSFNLTSSQGTGNGGAMFCSGKNSAVINCLFIGNTAVNGGGLCNSNNTATTIINSKFIGNMADYGGGICNNYDDCNPMVTNCVFSNNIANWEGGGIYTTSISSPTITNSIIYDNIPDNIFGTTGIISYNCIGGGFSGYGNIDENPVFVRNPNAGIDGIWGTQDDDYGDLHLQPDSPCIDAGFNNTVSQLNDCDGNPRLVDDPNTPDTGSGTPPIVDMGCYEYQIGTISPKLLITPYPLIAGQNATFTAGYSNPSTKTYLAYSLRGTGSVYIPFLNITINLKQPEQAGKTLTSDNNGTAEWVLPIPNAAAGRNVWFQACQYELKTNVVATRIE